MYADIIARIGHVAKNNLDNGWQELWDTIMYKSFLALSLSGKGLVLNVAPVYLVRFGFEDTVKHFFSKNDKNHSGDKPCLSNNILTSFLSIIT